MGGARPPLPPVVKEMNVEVKPYLRPIHRTVSFRALTSDPDAGAPVPARVAINGINVGRSNGAAISDRFVAHRVGTGITSHRVCPQGRAVPAQGRLYKTEPIDLGFADF